MLAWCVAVFVCTCMYGVWVCVHTRVSQAHTRTSYVISCGGVFVCAQNHEMGPHPPHLATKMERFCWHSPLFWGRCPHPLEDGATFTVGQLRVRALAAPCHTKGHVMYFVEAPGADVPPPRPSFLQ